MLPPQVKLGEAGETRLAAYLYEEINTCRWERQPYVSKLARLKEKYRAPFPEFPKDFPMANMSQITIPVIKTAVNTLSSRIVQTVMAADPLVSVRTDDNEYQTVASDYERFLKIYSDERLEAEEVVDDWITESIQLGTSILEVTHHKCRRNIVTYDALTQEYTKEAKDVFVGPKFFHFPIEDFWIRPQYQDHQTAPWCGKVLRLTWSQIKDMAMAGDLDPEKIDRLWNHRGLSEQDVSEVQKSDEDVEKFRPHDRDQFQIFELCVRWDVDGEGLEEELIIRFHEDSRTILRVFYSGFKNGRRPWEVARFIKILHRFYAEGLAEMLEHLQEEISTIHNQRIDNATIANLRIILVSRLIRGLAPGDRLWSGKVVKVSNVKEDVGTLQLGDIYPSTAQNESIAQGYVREVSGAGEVATGMAQPVTRTTATAQLSLLEELNRRFDKIIKGYRKNIRRIFIQLDDLFGQYGTAGLAEQWLGPLHGRMLEQYLAIPAEVAGSRRKIRILATKSSINREVEFQTSIAVMNLVIQMGEKMLQLTAQLAPNFTSVVAHELVKAIRPSFTKVMQYTDPANADSAISVLSVLERILPAPEDMGGMAGAEADYLASVAGRAGAGAGGGTQQANGGGAPTAQGGGGMEDFMFALRQANGGGAGVSQPGRNGR
jgi:hypothetical protein